MANSKKLTPEEIALLGEEAGTADEAEVVVQDKMVKVTPKETLGRRWLGLDWVELEKDKEILVTQDQKRVLKEAGAIYI